MSPVCGIFLRNFLQAKSVFERKACLGHRPTTLTRMTSVTLCLKGKSIPIDTSTKLLCIWETFQMIPPTRPILSVESQDRACVIWFWEKSLRQKHNIFLKTSLVCCKHQMKDWWGSNCGSACVAQLVRSARIQHTADVRPLLWPDKKIVRHQTKSIGQPRS